MKEGMEEEPHKEGDGNPPKERGKKCDKFGKAVRQKSIAPKLDPEQRLEKGRGDKLDRRGEKGGGEEIGQISQNRLTAKDRVSEKRIRKSGRPEEGEILCRSDFAEKKRIWFPKASRGKKGRRRSRKAFGLVSILNGAFQLSS